MKVYIKKEFEINLPNLDTNHKTASRLSDEIDSAIKRIIGSYDSIVPLDEKIEYYDHYLVIDGYKKYKPCPFCSASEDSHREEGTDTFYFSKGVAKMEGSIYCISCGCHGPIVARPTDHFKELKEAAESKNQELVEILIKKADDLWEESARKAWNRNEI